MEQVLAREYGTEDIYKSVTNTAVGNLSVFGQGDMFSRYMTFACNKKLTEFYFIARRDEEKIRSMNEFPGCSISIISAGNKPDDYSETVVFGKIRVLRSFRDNETQEGFRVLMEKSQFARNLYEYNDLGDHMLLKVEAEKITYRSYYEMLNNLPEIVIHPGRDAAAETAGNRLEPKESPAQPRPDLSQ